MKRFLALINLETHNSAQYLSAMWLFARPAVNITFRWGSCDHGAEKGRGWVCSRGSDLPVSAVRLSSCGAPHRCRKWFSQKTPPSALRTRRATSFSIKPVVLLLNNKSRYYIGVFWYLTLDKTIFYTRGSVSIINLIDRKLQLAVKIPPKDN